MRSQVRTWWRRGRSRRLLAAAPFRESRFGGCPRRIILRSRHLWRSNCEFICWLRRGRSTCGSTRTASRSSLRTGRPHDVGAARAPCPEDGPGDRGRQRTVAGRDVEGPILLSWRTPLRRLPSTSWSLLPFWPPLYAFSSSLPFCRRPSVSAFEPLRCRAWLRGHRHSSRFVVTSSPTKIAARTAIISLGRERPAPAQPSSYLIAHPSRWHVLRRPLFAGGRPDFLFRSRLRDYTILGEHAMRPFRFVGGEAWGSLATDSGGGTVGSNSYEPFNFSLG